MAIAPVTSSSVAVGSTETGLAFMKSRTVLLGGTVMRSRSENDAEQALGLSTT